MGDTTKWFATKNNQVLHHALSPQGAAMCNRTFLPRTKDTAYPREELAGYAELCGKCLAKVRRESTGVVQLAVEPVSVQVVEEKPRRLTASQTWECLTLLQREQVLAWFVATYAPSRNAARFQLTKNASLTHAESIIAERWKGMGPK